MRKIFHWIGNIVLTILLILVVLVVGSKLSKSDDVLGFTPLKVLTGSMEPAIKIGDLIIVKAMDKSNIGEGDIITYRTNTGVYVTHRVVEVVDEGGSTMFRTKGDANNVEDKDLVGEEAIVGKYIFRLPAFGYLSDFMAKPLGFILLFVLPLFILLGKEIVNFSKA